MFQYIHSDVRISLAVICLMCYFGRQILQKEGTPCDLTGEDGVAACRVQVACLSSTIAK